MFDHLLESSQWDDSNEGHTIEFGWELRKLLLKAFFSLALNETILTSGQT